MPQTYYDFDPWRRAADNIASGMVAVAQAKNRKVMFDAEMQQRAPLVEAQTRNYNANAAGAEYDLSRAKVNDTTDEADAAELEKEVRQNPDGTFTFTQRGVQIFSGALIRKSKDAADLGSGIRGMSPGVNYVQNEREKRKNARRMNREDNIAAGERNDADNAAVATRDFNLSPGAGRFDASGKLIVQNPSAASQQKGDSLPVGVKQSLETLGKEWAMAIAEGKMEDAERIAASVRATREKYATGQNNSLTPPPTQAQGVGTPAASGQRVRVKSPSGQVGTIPVDQLDAAMQQGYVQVQ